MVAYRFHSGNIAADPADMVREARRLAERYSIPVDMTAMERRAAWAALRARSTLASGAVLRTCH